MYIKIKKMMKILQLIPSLQSGGAEKLVCELTNALNALDNVTCDVGVMYPVDKQHHFTSELKDTRVFSFNKTSGINLRVPFALCKEIRRNKYQAVHAHLNAIPYLFLASIIFRKVRFVATIHSDAFFESGGKISWLIRKVLFKLRLVEPIAISEESRQSFVQCYNIDPKVIYNGVSECDCDNVPDELRNDTNDLIFIHPASCQPVKNQELLLKAFQKVTEKYSQVYLYWFGDNSAYRTLFDELSIYLSDNIKYCGCVKDVRRFLLHADAVCLSSKIEGMPMVIIEGFSVGCMPLVTPVGGCLNMVQDVVNWLVAKNMSLQSYVDIIERLVSMPESERLQMRENAYNSYMKLYTVDTCARKYMAIYSLE